MKGKQKGEIKSEKLLPITLANQKRGNLLVEVEGKTKKEIKSEKLLPVKLENRKGKFISEN